MIDRQHFERTAFVSSVEDKIPGPDMIAMRCLRRETCRKALSGKALSEHALRLGTDFEALLPPDALDLLAADRPAFPRP